MADAALLTGSSPSFNAPSCQIKAAGYASIITGIVMVVLGMCLAAGWLGPGVAYHLSAYMGAGCVLLALSSFAIAACLLDVPLVQKDAK